MARPEASASGIAARATRISAKARSCLSPSARSNPTASSASGATTRKSPCMVASVAIANWARARPSVGAAGSPRASFEARICRSSPTRPRADAVPRGPKPVLLQHERLVDEVPEQLENGLEFDALSAADGLGRLQRPAPNKDGESSKERTLQFS